MGGKGRARATLTCVRNMAIRARHYEQLFQTVASTKRDGTRKRKKKFVGHE